MHVCVLHIYELCNVGEYGGLHPADHGCVTPRPISLTVCSTNV